MGSETSLPQSPLLRKRTRSDISSASSSDAAAHSDSEIYRSGSMSENDPNTTPRRFHRQKQFFRKVLRSNTSASLPSTPSPIMVRQAQLRSFQEQRPHLSPHQVELVVSTWTILKVNIDELGPAVFTSLFANYPDTIGAFSVFRHLDPISGGNRYAKEIAAHGMRVTATLEKLVENIDEPSFIVNHLHALGRKHVMFDAKPEYFDLIGPQFLIVIEPMLKEHWSPEVEQAWADLFSLMSHLMKEDMML